jgi:Ran-interacting Mog1 protein
MAPETATSRSLFGGAFEVQLPARFVDIADFREVPDNQTVGWSRYRQIECWALA